jgi:phosphate:Na+ symporter
VEAFVHLDLEQAMKVEPQEQVIDALVREAKSRHVRRLRDGLCSVEYGFVLEDLLTAYERSADHCSNIAVELLQVAEGKLETHEYLNALKTGQLEESAKFNRRFNRYQARYVFPDEE